MITVTILNKKSTQENPIQPITFVCKSDNVAALVDMYLAEDTTIVLGFVSNFAG